MKKFLLSLAAVALCTSAMADTATFDFTSDDYGLPNDAETYVTTPVTLTQGDVSITLNGDAQAWRYWNDGLRVYYKKSPTLTITATNQNITKIQWTAKTGVKFAATSGGDAITEWTGNEASVTLYGNVGSGNAALLTLTVTYGEETGENPGGGNDEPNNPGEDNPNNPGGGSDTEGNVTQVFTTGIGFPEGPQANVPTTPTVVTATDTNIEYTVYGTNVNTGKYLMIAGKVVEDAYISWTLDFPMSQLIMTTTSGTSTNANSKVKVFAGETEIGEYIANVQNSALLVEIPEAYQAVGTIYKVQSANPNYNQQFASFTYVKVGNEGETPEQPDEPTAPEGVITVTEALQLITDGYKGEAQVKGIISEITEVSTQYGNATYIIKDAMTDAEGLTIYRGYWLEGEKFTAEDQIEVGATVTVEGTLTLYNGSTPEMNAGNKILSYEAPSGEVPTPPTPDEPEGESVTFDFTDIESLGLDIPADVTEFDLSNQTISDGEVTVSFFSNEGATTPIRLFGNNSGWTFRFYKDTEFTVSVASGYYLTGIEFDGTNLGKDWTYSSGTFNNGTWTPDGDESTVTIGKSATGNNPTIKTMTVFYDSKGSSSVIETVEAQDGEAVYFNLNGMRVQNPDKGIFIKIENGNAMKVVK